MLCIYRGVNVHHNVGKLEAILCHMKLSFYFNIALVIVRITLNLSNAPKCSLNNGVSLKTYLQAAQNGFQFSYIMTYIHP